jgi:hypothetical protein
MVIVAFLWTRSAHDSGLASEEAANHAAKVTAAFGLQMAAPAMQAWYSQQRTYAGATVHVTGVTVVRADASSFCLQAGDGANVQHLVGPSGNAPVDGPC